MSNTALFDRYTASHPIIQKNIPMSPSLVIYTPPQLSSLGSSKSYEAERKRKQQSLLNDDEEEKSDDVGNAIQPIIDHLTQIASSVAATRQPASSSNSTSNSNIQCQSTQPPNKKSALNPTIPPTQQASKVVDRTVNRPSTITTNGTMGMRQINRNHQQRQQ